MPECSITPKEQKVKTCSSRKRFSVSVLKDNPQKETRVALTPMGISVLSANGFKVLVEQGAGLEAGYSDLEYVKSGAEILTSRRDLFKSDVMLKVSPFEADDIEYVNKDQTLISYLGIALAQKKTLQAILDKKAVAVALEYIQTLKHFYPVNLIDSEIAGRAAVHIGAQLLSKQNGGKGVLLGGITGVSPALVVIIGTGTAALYAARTALACGAEVRVFDSSVCNLAAFREKIGTDIFTSVLLPQVLDKALSSADLLIGAKSIQSPQSAVITGESLSLMKKGSVAVDLNISTGQCFETSRPATLQNPSFEVSGVIHFCPPDIAALVPRTASIALSNILYPFINEIYTNGGIYQEINLNPLIRQSVYCCNGFLTNMYLSKKFNIKARDIDLYLM